MPKHRAVNTAKIDETIQNGGLKAKTLKKRRRVGDNFISFVKSIDESVAADEMSKMSDYAINLQAYGSNWTFFIGNISQLTN